MILLDRSLGSGRAAKSDQLYLGRKVWACQHERDVALTGSKVETHEGLMNKTAQRNLREEISELGSFMDVRMPVACSTGSTLKSSLRFRQT